jgi:2,4-dienoyl-CoA reductase-like NADH-dependent reductase (Old Yellow Enzyme family)
MSRMETVSGTPDYLAARATGGVGLITLGATGVDNQRAAGDCTGLGLIRKATEDGARAACAI